MMPTRSDVAHSHWRDVLLKRLLLGAVTVCCSTSALVAQDVPICQAACELEVGGRWPNRSLVRVETGERIALRSLNGRELTRALAGSDSALRLARDYGPASKRAAVLQGIALGIVASSAVLAVRRGEPEYLTGGLAIAVVPAAISVHQVRSALRALRRAVNQYNADRRP